MISFIELENWKSHCRSRLEFTPGTNVLVGLSGAGKGSVFDALCFALYGTFPALSARKVALTELIQNKPSPQEQAKIRMGFSLNGKIYEVERIIQRHGLNQAKLTENGKLLAGPKPTEVSERIAQLSEISYELFCRAVYAEQNNLDYFLELSPRERKQKFDELLSIDQYERVRENATQALKRLKKLTEEKTRFLEEQEKKLALTPITEMDARIRQKEEELQALARELPENERELSEKEKQINTLQKSEKKFREFESALTATSARLELTQSRLQKAKKETGSQDPVPELQKNREETEQLREKILAHKTGKEKELQETSRLQTQLAQLQKSATGLDGLGGQCPVCRQPVSEHTRNGLQAEFRTQQETLSTLLQSAQKNLHELQKTEIQLTQQQTFLQTQSTRLQILCAQQEQIQKLMLEEKELGQKEQELRNQAATISFNSAEFNQARETWMQLQKTVQEKRARTNAGKEILSELKTRQNEIQSLQKSLQQLKTRTNHETRMSQKMGLFIEALKNTQTQLRETLIDSVNEAMNQLWPRIYPYEDLTGARIEIQDGDYEVLAQNRDHELIRVEGILSGGERTATALALRMAFSLVLTRHLGWIILDEPTH
ncbi:MAG: hypothetical protein HY917_03030, partial [Candidatus Diapherotrites archaeon]|nr:hypothetical protein [Candidatus Diapherotrites archaeon]